MLLVSNLVGPKIYQIGPLQVSGAQLLFPVTYICGDIFTEVYGYEASRRAIWLGFFGMGLLTVMGKSPLRCRRRPGGPISRLLPLFLDWFPGLRLPVWWPTGRGSS